MSGCEDGDEAGGEQVLVAGEELQFEFNMQDALQYMNEMEKACDSAQTMHNGHCTM